MFGKKKKDLITRSHVNIINPDDRRVIFLSADNVTWEYIRSVERELRECRGVNRELENRLKIAKSLINDKSDSKPHFKPPACSVSTNCCKCLICENSKRR